MTAVVRAVLDWIRPPTWVHGLDITADVWACTCSREFTTYIALMHHTVLANAGNG